VNVHVLTRHAGQYTICAMPDDQREELLADFAKGTSRTITFLAAGVTVQLLRTQIVGIELEPEAT
jgi:hypothetical protein